MSAYLCTDILPSHLTLQRSPAIILLGAELFMKLRWYNKEKAIFKRPSFHATLERKRKNAGMRFGWFYFQGKVTNDEGLQIHNVSPIFGEAFLLLLQKVLLQPPTFLQRLHLFFPLHLLLDGWNDWKQINVWIDIASETDEKERARYQHDFR